MLRIHPFDPPLAHSEQDVQRILREMLDRQADILAFREVLQSATALIHEQHRTIKDLREVISRLQEAAR